jgi:hypothetical protein
MNKSYVFILILVYHLNVFSKPSHLFTPNLNASEITLLSPPKRVQVVSPNGGENWQAGSSQIITWTDNIHSNVTIELYKGGTFHSIISASTGSDGSENWNIPFTLESGTDYNVKITSVDDSTITDMSDADFTIIGNQVTVTSPNGGENYLIGSSQIIEWTNNFSSDVEIQLFKGGVFNSSITTSTVSDGSYTWNISNTLVQGSDYKIRISSVIDDNIFDLSDADFTLSNEIIVTTPNGGESWQQGTTQTISWTDNISENVKIELFKGGLFNSEITASTTSDGSFSWAISASTIPGLDYSVKITSVDNTTIFDFSNANFEIFEGNVTVINPNGGESWQAGISQIITWTDNINSNVAIELYKGGTFHSIISASTGSDGSENWDIPFTLESGTDYNVKITSVDDPSITDMSDANFTIIGNQITVIVPNGGEQWLDTDDQQIIWTDNLTGNVEIQLFKNDVFHSSITTSTPSDDSYTWNIPGNTPSGNDYKIKILSVDDANIYDISDADFTIINYELTVISPNGGENWQKETTHTINWNDNINGNVKIELYWGINNYDSEITPSTPSTGSYNWNIPVQTTIRTNYKIKITSLDDPSLFDFSDDYFGIFEGNITITEPNGGEVWQAGTTRNISWTDSINENVMIELFKGGSFHSVISTLTASDGSKNWNIPFTLESGSDYMIKITSVNNPELFDFSDANFTIVGNEITVTSPNGGEDYIIENPQIITWTDNFSSNVEIQLFKAGAFHSLIENSTASDGSFTWNIDDPTIIQGSDYKIRISSVIDANVLDFSDNDFTLSSEIIVTTPNGGESWQQGTNHTISWSDNINENVRIDLFKGGVFASEITAPTPSTGSFSWDIPVSADPGLDYKVKITSINNATVFDYSDANFSIYAPYITVDIPNGGESWKAGTTQSIHWTDNINENVSIDLYKGGVFHSVIETSTSSDGSRSWDIPFPQESGSDYRIKITSVNNPALFDFSDADFIIVGNEVTVTSPNGSEIWLETEAQLITWTDNLTGNVEIQLFKADVFHSSISSGTPSDGQHPWNPPASTTSGDDYRIKILSVDDGNVFDLSDANFTIINNNFKVITPNGGENWLANTSQDITWTTDISGNVKIDLYKGGVFDSQIIASIPESNNLYSWAIPGSTATGSDYKIRITSIDNPVLFDESDASFTIFTGGITVNSPNGGESWQAGETHPITWTDNITEN